MKFIVSFVDVRLRIFQIETSWRWFSLLLQHAQPFHAHANHLRNAASNSDSKITTNIKCRQINTINTVRKPTGTNHPRRAPGHAPPEAWPITRSSYGSSYSSYEGETTHLQRKTRNTSTAGAAVSPSQIGHVCSWSRAHLIMFSF